MPAASARSATAQAQRLPAVPHCERSAQAQGARRRPLASPTGQLAMAFDPLLPQITAGAVSLAVAMTPLAALGLAGIAGWRQWRRQPVAPAAELGLAAVAGACLGAATIALSPLWPRLTLEDIFASGSVWDLPGTALVADRLPQAMSGLQVAMQTPFAALPTGTAWLLGAGFLLVVACMLLPLLSASKGSRAEVALVATVVLVLTLFAVVYLACFLPWILNLLNFWALALLLAAFVYWRHGSL